MIPVEDSIVFDRSLAFLLGALSGYGIAEIGENFIEYVNVEYSADLPLEKITSL
jgi:hypothetical protein